MTPDEIRASYIRNAEKLGSKAIPASHLVPENDSTTLFVGSGMQPMVPYLLGQPHPMGNDLANVQPCIRTGDIDEVGDLTHLTFFEMIGRWELGADKATYKRHQIESVMRWQIETLGLDPQRLYVSIYAGNESLGIDFDSEALQVWEELFTSYGIEPTIERDPFKYGASRGGRIYVYDDSENWWSRAGVPSNMPVGEPGGPDSEMFFDHDPEGDPMTHPADGGSRFVEIGNNVFMSHRRTESGFEMLGKPNIDYGGGLERIVSAAMGQVDIFLTPFFTSALAHIEQASGQQYADNTKAFRVILDHCRASVFLIASGVNPDNKDAGYIVRRLLRRAVRFGRKLGLDGAFLSKLAVVFIDEANSYDFVKNEKAMILQKIAAEEEAFSKTLRNGDREIRNFMKKGIVTGRNAFYFYETYGFPLEITIELLAEEGLTLTDPEGFAIAEVEHSEKSKSASAGKFAGGMADHGETTVAYHTTTHLLLAGLREVLGDHVHQRGSNITPERIRFDFSHTQKVNKEELGRVAEFVNAALASDAKITSYETDKDAAREAGVEGSFWEKYPERVTIYNIESSDGKVWSKELCGGPHVESTSMLLDMGDFAILKEESSSAGVRRIKARLKPKAD